MNFSANPTFLIKTLGCKVNQYEGQAMREGLIKNGLAEAENEIADFYVINSCTVTHKADSKTRNLIRYFNKVNPEGKIVVAGCYAEFDADRKMLMKIPGVTHLIRNNEKARIAEVLAINNGREAAGEKSGITDFKDRDRAFVKIQDGCDHRCSYCKVRLVRGFSKSRRAEEILKEVKCLIEKGFKEIVLTGTCLGAWGQITTDSCQSPRSTGFGRIMRKEAAGGLPGLIRAIARIEGRFRIRLSSIEPGYVTDELIRIFKDEPKLCKHLHISLQSGDDKILKHMNRPYATRKFMRLVTKIRRHVTDAAITTDILLGFPGEDDRSFHRTERFIKAIAPSRMHVFSYSRREGTVAAKFKSHARKEEINERANILMGLSKRFQADFAKRFINKMQEVLLESQRCRFTGFLTGYTDRYVRVLIDGPDTLKNRLVSIRSRSLYHSEPPALYGDNVKYFGHFQYESSLKCK